MTSLAEQMEADAQEAMKFTRKHFVIELNFSEASLAQLDEQCDAVDYTLGGGKSEENLQLLRRIWGAYLGEVVRRQHGGEWVTAANASDQETTALQCDAKTIFPHDRVYQRLAEGSEHNLVDFYQQ